MNPALLVLAVVLLAGVLGWWIMRRRDSAPDVVESRRGQDEALDTLAAWPPEAARVMTLAERRAYQLLVNALPHDHIVLAQVPLARFLRVPTRHSYREWIRRVGRLNADLLVCGSSAQVLAVVNIRPAQGRDSDRGRQRHDRMDRVLRKAGIRVLIWDEDALPRPEQVLEMALGPRPVGAPATASVPPEGARLGAGTAASTQAEPALEAEGQDTEPVPSTFYDDLDSGPTPLARRPRE